MQRVELRRFVGERQQTIRANRWITGSSAARLPSRDISAAFSVLPRRQKKGLWLFTHSFTHSLTTIHHAAAVCGPSSWPWPPSSGRTASTLPGAITAFPLEPVGPVLELFVNSRCCARPEQKPSRVSHPPHWSQIPSECVEIPIAQAGVTRRHEAPGPQPEPRPLGLLPAQPRGIERPRIRYGFWFVLHDDLCHSRLTDLQTGRPWAIQELREKSWEDIHSLWWVCVKERNRIATSNYERERFKPGYGAHESEERDNAVRHAWTSCSSSSY